MNATSSTGVASKDVAAPDIVTPKGSSGFVSSLLTRPTLPALAARLGSWLATWLNGPIRLGTNVLVVRHEHVTQALHRDLDFLIAPVNEKRILDVNGPFVLGMDRGATLALERDALYQSLSNVDLEPLRNTVEIEAANKVNAAGDEIDVIGAYARPIAAMTAQALFGVTGPDPKIFMEVARSVFAHTFLNLSGDKIIEKRAIDASKMMRDWLSNEIDRRRKSGQLGVDMMGALLRGNLLDDEGARRTLGGMLVGSIDTTASSVAKIVTTIAKDRALLNSIAADVNDKPRLAGWCREALRRWPHNPILLRRAAADTELAETEIKAGDQIILWTQAAMLDTAAFPDPQFMRSDRPAAAYLHFGTGLHPCAGRAVNAFQIPALVGALVRRGIKSVGPMQWAGPFPDRLPLHFER